MKHRFARALLTSAAVVAAVVLAGCDPSYVPTTGRAMAPLSESMLSTLAEKQMDKGSPILIRLFKEESELEVWKKRRDGRFALLKTYPICRWSGDLGPKKKEGDRQAPEGFYTVTPGQMNPNSSYYLSFNTGYPNAYDRAHGYTGSQLMVHGDCSSRGCYAMTDEQIQEIYALARESFFGGQKAFQLAAFPFRMTALNMAKHRDNPNFAFWKMLKEGYDHFEVTRQEPQVAVCDKRYVYNAEAPDGTGKPLSFNPTAACPAYQIDKSIAATVLAYQSNEQRKLAQFIAEGVRTVPPRKGDGGVNPSFLAKFGAQEGYDSNGRVVQISTAPGALPRGVSQASNASTSSQTSFTNQRVAEVTLATEQAPSSFTGLLDNIFGNGEEKASQSTASNKPASPARTVNTQTAHSDERRAPPLPARNPNGSRQTAAHMSLPLVKPPESVAPRAVAHSTASQQASKPEEPVRKDNPPKDTAAPQIRTAFSDSARRQDGLLPGAQPVVPAGSFNGRWAGLQ